MDNKHNPLKDIDKIVSHSLTFIMAIDFICTIAIYAAMKMWLSAFWAECWIIAVYAYCLHSNISLIAPKCKEEMMKRMSHELAESQEASKESIEGESKDESEDKDLDEDKPKA